MICVHAYTWTKNGIVKVWGVDRDRACMHSKTMGVAHINPFCAVNLKTTAVLGIPSWELVKLCCTQKVVSALIYAFVAVHVSVLRCCTSVCVHFTRRYTAAVERCCLWLSTSLAGPPIPHTSEVQWRDAHMCVRYNWQVTSHFLTLETGPAVSVAPQTVYG